jgi:hypothetical protein
LQIKKELAITALGFRIEPRAPGVLRLLAEGGKSIAFVRDAQD